MSKVFKGVFGGSESKGRSGPTSGDIQRSIDFIERSMEQAREDIFKYAPMAQENRLRGIEGAFNLYQQGVPSIANALQLGNQMAQETTAGALDPTMAAILGQPIDTSALAPRNVPMDLSFLEQAQMPEFQTMAEPQPTYEPAPWMRLGNFGFGGF